MLATRCCLSGNHARCVHFLKIHLKLIYFCGTLYLNEEIVTSRGQRTAGDRSVYKTLAIQTQEPEFDHQNSG